MLVLQELVHFNLTHIIYSLPYSVLRFRKLPGCGRRIWPSQLPERRVRGEFPMRARSPSEGSGQGRVSARPGKECRAFCFSALPLCRSGNRLGQVALDVNFLPASRRGFGWARSQNLATSQGTGEAKNRQGGPGGPGRRAWKPPWPSMTPKRPTFSQPASTWASPNFFSDLEPLAEPSSLTSLTSFALSRAVAAPPLSEREAEGGRLPWTPASPDESI